MFFIAEQQSVAAGSSTQALVTTGKNNMSSHPVCPVCGHLCALCYSQGRGADIVREFFSCPHCLAIHVPKQFHLPGALEKAEYDKHQNLPEDVGYRRFLSRMFEPLTQRVVAPASGLDFGCGPGPVLALMLEEAGYRMARYDLYYFPDEPVLEQSYDFITATEVVEHLSQPLPVLDRLWSLLHPGGVLGLMTKRVIDVAAFKTWHYKNDPTHITFFHERTLQWLAGRWLCECELITSDVVFFRKPG